MPESTAGSTTRLTVPARRGRAFEVDAGDEFEVINTHGTQVVDMWALTRPDLDRRLSMEHTRAVNSRLTIRPGDILYGDDRRPMLEVMLDTSPGVHDTLIAACDPVRYEMLGHEGYHDNCSDNFRAALRELGFDDPPPVPSPLNLFMNIPWSPEGELGFEPAISKPGDLVRFRAERDLVVAVSSCPQDMVPISGRDQTPRDFDVQILPGGSAQ